MKPNIDDEWEKEKKNHGWGETPQTFPTSGVSHWEEVHGCKKIMARHLTEKENS